MLVIVRDREEIERKMGKLMMCGGEKWSEGGGLLLLLLFLLLLLSLVVICCRKLETMMKSAGINEFNWLE